MCIYKQCYATNGKWNYDNIEKKVGIGIDIEEKKKYVVLMFHLTVQNK